MITRILALAFLGSVAGTTLAAEDPPQFILEGAGQKAEVRIDESRVRVRMINRGKKDLPKSIGITLRSSNGREREVELAATEPALKNGAWYHGSLPATEESYVGVSVRIPFRSSPPTVLHSTSR